GGDERLQLVAAERIVAGAQEAHHLEQRRRHRRMLLAEGGQAFREIFALDPFDLERLVDGAADAGAAADRKLHVQAAVGLVEQLTNRLGHAPVDDEKPGRRGGVVIDDNRVWHKGSPQPAALQESGPRRSVSSGQFTPLAAPPVFRKRRSNTKMSRPARPGALQCARWRNPRPALAPASRTLAPPIGRQTADRRDTCRRSRPCPASSSFPPPAASACSSRS